MTSKVKMADPIARCIFRPNRDMLFISPGSTGTVSRGFPGSGCAAGLQSKTIPLGLNH